MTPDNLNVDIVVNLKEFASELHHIKIDRMSVNLGAFSERIHLNDVRHLLINMKVVYHSTLMHYVTILGHFKDNPNITITFDVPEEELEIKTTTKEEYVIPSSEENKSIESNIISISQEVEIEKF